MQRKERSHSPHIDNVDDDEVMRIHNRRGKGDDREYQLVWKDGSLVWKKLCELQACPILVALYDRYIDKYPTKEISYAQFTARHVLAIGLMSDNVFNDCAVHSVEMAFELMGLKEEARCLRGLGADFIAKLAAAEGRSGIDYTALDASSSRVLGFKLKELSRFLVQEVPKVSWRVNMELFSRKNWFAGKGVGPGAVADLVISGKLPMGMYLLHAYKSSGQSHCVALRYVNDELVVRKEGMCDGIMNQKWITNIRFIREFRISRVHEL
ncbi:hypothetical protein Gpo141_00001736 [Globisporangium polare]